MSSLKESSHGQSLAILVRLRLRNNLNYSPVELMAKLARSFASSIINKNALTEVAFNCQTRNIRMFVS